MRIRDFRADASTRYVGGTRIVFDPTTGITTYTPPGGLPRQGYPDAFHHSVTQKDGAEIELAETEDFVTCATSGHRIKIVYSANASGPDAATVNEIRSIVRRSNSKIVRESLRSSNNTRALTMRVDCDAGGSMNVYNVPVSNNAPAAIAATVESRLGRPTGSEAVRYWIFRDAGRHREGAFYVEGETFIPFDDRKTASDGPDGNIARVQTISSVIYKGVTGTNYWQTYTPLHELGHAMGATQPGSPYHTNSGHCTDGLDIMCYEEGHDNYNTTRCPPGTERGYDRPLGVPFDCGYDSYFDAATEPGEWLETHWNVAGPENAFLVERPAEIPPGGYSTEASITLDGTRNGAPGTASVHGHVLRTSGAAAAGSVSVVFDKYVNGNWETMSTAQRTLDANGYYEVVNWSVGAGRWRVHTVFPRQGNYAEAVSAYREFDIQ
jgi:hypothetical protein